MKKIGYFKLSVILLIIVVVIDSYGIVSGELGLRYIFKPLITPTLLFSYLISTSKINKLYLAALLFAFVADVLLLNSTDFFFMLAIISFFIVHLLYIIIVTEDIRSYKRKDIYLAPIPFLIVYISVVLLVYQNLREFLVPILFYGIAVCTLGTLTFYNFLGKRCKSSLILFLGTFFFIVSNAMSAIEKFVLENRDLGVGIMITYVGAQFLISRYIAERSQTT